MFEVVLLWRHPHLNNKNGLQGPRNNWLPNALQAEIERCPWKHNPKVCLSAFSVYAGQKTNKNRKLKADFFHLGLMGQSREKDMWFPTPWYSVGKSSCASGITIEGHSCCYIQRRGWWLHCSLCDEDPELSKQSNSKLGYLEFSINCHSSISTTQRSPKFK